MLTFVLASTFPKRLNSKTKQNPHEQNDNLQKRVTSYSAVRLKQKTALGKLLHGP